MFVKVLCLVVLLTSQCVTQEEDENFLKIGGMFYEDEADQLQAAMEIGAMKFNFTTSIKRVAKRGEILEINNLVCELASEGVIGIIDGLGGSASESVQALCDMLELPHVMVQQNDINAEDWFVVNLYPSSEAFNMVLEDLVTRKEWQNFTILYVKGHSLTEVNKLMMMGNNTDKMSISIRELTGDDYRDVLQDCRDNGYFNFVVDCPSRHLELLLLHAQQVDLMSDDYSYIIVSPDVFTLDLSRYRYGGVNITGFRMTQLTSLNENLWKFVDTFNNMTGEDVGAESIKTKALLTYDAMNVFSQAIKTLGETDDDAPREIKAETLDCENYDFWSLGSSLLNFMKTNILETSLTRSLRFDGKGHRNEIIMDVLELTPAGNQTIGEWTYNTTNIIRPFLPSNDFFDTIMRNKSFKILIALVEPYAFVKDSEEILDGNDRYEGFAIDLIMKLSEILGFNYEFEVDSSGYGSLKNGKWDGMVLKLREELADFAICDLTITKERKQGIDFSTPFMTLGIGILYKEPSKQPPEMFSFMAVFSKEVWLYMMFVQVGVGIIMIFVGRISHKEWQNPVPCIEQPEELTNQFSFANSIWLIIGSVMQQGSEIAPIALAPRMITSVWWFFTMVIVASYVGTLVAFLTVEKNVLPFQNVEELYNSKSVMYGAKNLGSTIKFFEQSKDPILKKIYAKMIANNWNVEKNELGVERAETSNYAFFTESTSIEYYQERHCDLLQIGDLLDSKSYGIGMKQNSIYKRYIDDALLKLKEKGEIQKIRNLWWKEKRGGGKCGEKQEEEQKQLSMKNVIGAFVVLGVGCIIGLFMSVLDMLWGVFKRSVKYNTTFKYELIEELKFAIKFDGDVKPVNRPKSDEGSSEALADAEVKEKDEAKDELGSLRSAPTIRSGRSTSTNRTCHSRHSHSSKHSGRELSVAFARSRKHS